MASVVKTNGGGGLLPGDGNVARHCRGAEATDSAAGPVGAGWSGLPVTVGPCGVRPRSGEALGFEPSTVVRTAHFNTHEEADLFADMYRDGILGIIQVQT